MRKATSLIFTSCMAFMQVANLPAYADSSETKQDKNTAAKTSSPISKPFSSFTGKITKNKVRLRLQPNLDGSILRELNRNDLLVVVGEADDFYSVQAPTDIKAYVYRTYVLDNVIEGNKVNIRLEPNTESPVVAQMNAGERVEGIISPLNSKWYEIKLPESVHFYVSKDYVEKIGDPSLLSTISQRREEVSRLLNSTHQVSLAELQKPFPEINLEGVTKNLNKIIADYPELPEQAERAKSLLTMIQDNYLQKKIAYLEAQQSQKPSLLKDQPVISSMMPAGQNIDTNDNSDSGLSAKMGLWQPQEEKLYKEWLADHENRSLDEFYQDQRNNSITIRGVLESYDRHVKNKPGDFIVLNNSTRVPIAYLYSTKVNLNDKVGQEVVLDVIERPNNNFAFPAYYVLSVE